MSKHTPGPWRATGLTDANMQSYSQPWGVSVTDEYSTTLICGCFGDTRGGLEAAEANAHLIAAAPDTAEERDRLIWLLARIMDSLPQKRDWLDPQYENEARAAITKATGE